MTRAPAWPAGVRDAVVERLAVLVLHDLDVHPFGTLPTDTGVPPPGHHRSGADARGDGHLPLVADGRPTAAPPRGQRRSNRTGGAEPGLGGVRTPPPTRLPGPHAGNQGVVIPVTVKLS
jgi:hypothetical protein